MPTKIQLRILTFIKVYLEKNKQYPTRQEIANRLKCSKQNINGHLKLIEKKGYLIIKRRGRTYIERNIKLTKKGRQLLEL